MVRFSPKPSIVLTPLSSAVFGEGRAGSLHAAFERFQPRLSLPKIISPPSPRTVLYPEALQPISLHFMSPFEMQVCLKVCIPLALAHFSPSTGAQ